MAVRIFVRIFAAKIMMEEKRYPVIGEEDGSGCMSVEEPAVAYVRHASSGIVNMSEEAEKMDRIPAGMFGFYTVNPEAFKQRVDEIEADMDEVDAGIEAPEKWIQIDDFWAAMRKEHPWL